MKVKYRKLQICPFLIFYRSFFQIAFKTKRIVDENSLILWGQPNQPSKTLSKDFVINETPLRVVHEVHQSKSLSFVYDTHTNPTKASRKKLWSWNINENNLLSSFPLSILYACRSWALQSITIISSNLKRRFFFPLSWLHRHKKKPFYCLFRQQNVISKRTLNRTKTDWIEPKARQMFFIGGFFPFLSSLLHSGFQTSRSHLMRTPSHASEKAKLKLKNKKKFSNGESFSSSLLFFPRITEVNEANDVKQEGLQR